MTGEVREFPKIKIAAKSISFGVAYAMTLKDIKRMSLDLVGSAPKITDEMIVTVHRFFIERFPKIERAERHILIDQRANRILIGNPESNTFKDYHFSGPSGKQYVIYGNNAFAFDKYGTPYILVYEEGYGHIGYFKITNESCKGANVDSILNDQTLIYPALKDDRERLKELGITDASSTAEKEEFYKWRYE